MNPNNSSVLYIPHGGGPLPLMGDPSHSKLVHFLREIPQKIPAPKNIVVISAHWEEPITTVTSGPRPPLFFDYYGFPEETYRYQYPSPGNPKLAQSIAAALGSAGLPCRLDSERGFDHGHFIPLALMYPKADIPTVQISLTRGLNPEVHIQIGRALRPLLREPILFLGSGFSFHNLRALMDANSPHSSARNDAFHQWLNQTLTSSSVSNADREKNLLVWDAAPEARYCHPREEHLLPLHICFGLGQKQAELVFYDEIIGKKVSGFLWV